MIPALESRDVTKTHPGPVHALRGVSMRVLPGELVAVMGPSGSGKTTLSQMLGTLDRPTTGSVLVDGVDVSSLRDRELSRLRADKIGFVFQSFHLSPLMSVLDNVAEGMLYTGMPRGNRRDLAERRLAELGLKHRMFHRPFALSGGERQRTAIARALMGDPSVILADEPTGNLDTVNSAAIMHLLQELAEDGLAVVVVTHDAEVAAGARRIIAIRDGLVESRSPIEV